MDNTEKLLRALIVEIDRCIGLSEGVNVEHFMYGISNQEEIDLLNRVLSERPLTITGRAQEIGGSYDFGDLNYINDMEYTRKPIY